MATKTTGKTDAEAIGKSTDDRIRFHENYFGMQAATFTCPNEFELTEHSLRFTFDSWSSIDSFERGDAPLERLKKEFVISDDFEQTKKDNPFFGELIEVALSVCNVGGRGYIFKRLFLSTVGKCLSISAVSSDGGDQPNANKYGAEYDRIIAENLTLIAQIVGFMIEFAKTNDDFLANSDLING